MAERQRTERLLSLQYVITRVLAGVEQPGRGGAAHPAHHGREPGLARRRAVGGRRGRQFLRCVDVWHAAELRRRRLPGRAARRARRARRGAAGAGLAAPPAAVDPRHRRGADACRWPAFAAASGLHGAFAIPLRNGPEVIGVMAFFSREVRQANDDHLSMLSALGGQIGQFMERKRIEQGLRDSEERYRSVIAALDEGIILVDAAGRRCIAHQRQRRADPGRARRARCWARPGADAVPRRRRRGRSARCRATSCRSCHAAHRASRARTSCSA